MIKQIVPTAFQHRVMMVPEGFNLALLGGRGGGKSTGVCLIALRHLVKHGAAAKVLIVRETYKGISSLEDVMLGLLEQSFPNGGFRYNRQEKIARIADGGTVEFAAVESHRDISKMQGRECTLLIIDEAGLLKSFTWVTLLKSNMRSPDDIPMSTIITANPGGAQHERLRKTFISPALAWHPFQVNGETWVHCPSTLLDNQHLNHEDYKRKLTAACGHDVDLARAWIEGSWNINRGAFFGQELDEAVHMLPSALPFNITRAWSPQLAIDWGSSAPAIVLYHGRCPGDVPGIAKGSVVVFDETSTAAPDDPTRGLMWPAGKLAEVVKETCARWNMHPMGVIDDAVGLMGQGDTLINLFANDYQISLQKPVKGRASGWAKIKELLHNATAKNGRPGLYISQRCSYLWATLPNITRDPNRPEDLDTNGPDHGADALRYACASTLFGIRNREVLGHY